MTDGQLAYSIAKLKERGLVDSATRKRSELAR